MIVVAFDIMFYNDEYARPYFSIYLHIHTHNYFPLSHRRFSLGPYSSLPSYSDTEFSLPSFNLSLPHFLSPPPLSPPPLPPPLPLSSLKVGGSKRKIRVIIRLLTFSSFLSENLIFQDLEESIESFLALAVERRCEGLMLKILEDFPPLIAPAHLRSGYHPDIRSTSWIKLKKDYLDHLGDSFDLVPIAGWWGNGRKAGWISPFLLASYDAESCTFQSVCKVMSGFSDEMYRKTKAFFLDGMHAVEEEEVEKKKEESISNEEGSFREDEDYVFASKVLRDKPLNYEVSEAFSPSFWFPPLVVWEVKGADLTSSPLHTCGSGRVEGVEGVSLR